MKQVNYNMVEERFLTTSELEAKRYMKNMITKASLKPCDVGGSTKISATLPDWYNERKFKRGQKYFLDNRLGMLTSNLYGLYTALAEPKGLEVLDLTGKSSTVETAKKRYVSTIVNVLTWYEGDLRPNSKSWTSLNRVRKLHFNASNNAFKNGIGLITQYELVIATFGFMGFALLRPQFLGIRCDKIEDREGFVHFWAVIGHMLGVEDEFNMCLFNVETVENICLNMLRYLFIPIIQLETPKFKELMNALLKGLSSFLPNMSYNIQMFLVKRIIGVPGYQYCVDLSKEKMCKQIFSIEDLNAAKAIHSKEAKYLWEMYKIQFDYGVPVVAPKNDGYTAHNGIIENKNANLAHSEWAEVGDKKFNWIMRTKSADHWKVHLNDSEFYALSKWEQFTIRWMCFLLPFYENPIGRYFCEMALSVTLFFIRRYYNSNVKN